ncbi:MAG: eukaryotic-like serine/threonine-protein kinase [Chloroflexota bacterium]|jgi:serine/threonine-protein kinase|nr:eukaryotic-like serine/threonine-protein kinase [Chloroflexota bacterium]
MAAVYEGEDTSLGRRVAIKVLHPQQARTQAAVVRFEREARSIAALSHPSIVDVYDFGQDDGRYYIIMQYVEGTSVKEVLRRGALRTQQAVDVGVQIAKALDYAHGRGIVHRDVKPQNILIMPDGGAKLVDFGIAVSQGDDLLTDDGSVLGTVHYVAPEQARGEPPTPATDIYSLGVVIYEMLTGHLPFDGATPVEIATKHVSAEPLPPSRHNPSIPPTLERAVLHAMEKDPQRRPPTAGDLARELLTYDDVFDQPTSQVPRPAPTTTSQSRSVVERRTVAAPFNPLAFDEAPSSQWPLMALTLLAVVLVAGLIPLWAAVSRYYF